MKIALLGDTHFGVRNDNPFFYTYFNKFYNEWFFPYLVENNVGHVIQLGDLFDRRKYVNFVTLQNAQNIFLNTLNQKFKSWILVGNHDSYFKNTLEVNSLQLLLKQYTNIRGIISPYETSFDGVKFLFIPWVCDANKDEVEKALNISKSQIVVGHFEFDGFDMYKGTPHHGHSSVDKSLLTKFEFVLSGHFHHKSSRGNIHYLGTPYEMTWGDFNDPKGFHLFDTRTSELEFVRNPYQIFHKIIYNDSEQDMSFIETFDFTQYKDTFVKVVVVNKTNPYMFDVFIEKMEKNHAYNVDVVDDHHNMHNSSDEHIISSIDDTLTILTKHVNQITHTVDKTKLNSLMIDLYNEALSVE